MAETVVSMARSMVGGAVSMAASAAAAEMSLLIGVRKDIWFIKDELETIQAFLEAAETMKQKDGLLKVWAKQIRDLSYNIEDGLGEFMEHVGSRSLSQRLMKLKDRHRIAMQIRDLKSRVEEVSIRNTSYSFIKTEASGATNEVDSYTEDVRNYSSSNTDEADLVGFAKPKEELTKLMDVNTENGLAKVICVVGMGGLGKTTLAKKTYENKEDILRNFQCCAWITVSQFFFKMEMLKDMIVQLLGDESLKNCLRKYEGKVVQVEDLANYLREELQDKRYFIVLDDLWTIDAWKWISSIAFPSSNNKGSRIIVTTRDVGLAKLITLESLIYHLEALDPVDAKSLLLRKTRKREEDIDKDENLKKLVEQLVKKCGRLPLAILTIGGILATIKVAEWRHFYNQLPSELESNPSLEALRRIVTLSYNHLPSHLKSCFLYLSIFPEDSEIQRRRLVERWIAEGFVRVKTGVNMEDVAKGYFNELINRSMIQPSRVNIEGIVTSCRVHDIMRDVMISISTDEKFVYLVGDDVAPVVQENFRHVAYHGNKFQKIAMDWSHVRSVTIFGQSSLKSSPLLCSLDLRMLRALDLADARFRITQKDMDNICLLRHLKYVKFRRFSSIYRLPRSIGKLKGLQSLDIGINLIASLPTEICKLQGLRSLRSHHGISQSSFDPLDLLECMKQTLCLPRVLTPLANPDVVIAELRMAYFSLWSASAGMRVPRGIGNLKELHTLETIDIKRTGSKAIEELGELTRLRKLSVATGGASQRKCNILCAAIGQLSSLRSLHVDARGVISTDTPEWLESISSPPPLLRTLKIDGCLGDIPNWVRNLMHLMKVYLNWSRLKEGGKSMEILGALPNLMLFCISGYACVGKKLVFVAGAFPNLRTLAISNSSPLSELIFEEGTSPQMERIYLESCRLESGIIGIKHLPMLKEISFSPGSAVAKLAVLQREVEAHPNHPVLRLLGGDISRHDLGGIVQESSDVQAEEVSRGSSACRTEPAAEGESSQSQVSVMPTTNLISHDDLLFTYNSC